MCGYKYTGSITPGFSVNRHSIRRVLTDRTLGQFGRQKKIDTGCKPLASLDIDIPFLMRYARLHPGGSGAAEPFEPRQVREEATVRRKFWVPPGNLPG